MHRHSRIEFQNFQLIVLNVLLVVYSEINGRSTYITISSREWPILMAIKIIEQLRIEEVLVKESGYVLSFIKL